MRGLLTVVAEQSQREDGQPGRAIDELLLLVPVMGLITDGSVEDPYNSSCSENGA